MIMMMMVLGRGGVVRTFFDLEAPHYVDHLRAISAAVVPFVPPSIESVISGLERPSWTWTWHATSILPQLLHNIFFQDPSNSLSLASGKLPWLRRRILS